MKARDFERAASEFRRAEAYGHGAAAAFNLGRTCHELGDFEGAVAAYRRAIGRGYPEAALNLGALYWDRRDSGAAEDAWREGARMGNARCAAWLARLLWSSGERAGAVATAHQAAASEDTYAASIARDVLQREERELQRDSVLAGASSPAEAMVAAVTTLPADARQMTPEDWRAIAAVYRRVSESVAADDQVLKRYQARAFKLVNRAQTEELRAALERVTGAMRAIEAYHDWWLSSGAEALEDGPQYTDPTEILKRYNKILREFGDLTPPDWRPGWRARLRATVAAQQRRAREQRNTRPPR